ncbi:hypothetical protein [Methanotorris formicicus]|uniref:Cohesin domain-containing protein n=1 Tax=Methanotorris formicicus Mc-S-70 TaxID=647171 RepID=H1L0G9_9EURY|nr:hypothetical protein [Methanotorris formicicus]EHP84864.1 hypothetical protein MetfoDRAFT_1543 [Methanotorris formicicus Mc-S-70]
MKRIAIILTLLFFNCVCSEDLQNVILKLEPEKVETTGDLIKINITVENIPPKDSLESRLNDNKSDGGLGGLDIYINYSPEYLESVGFDWSDFCKNEKIKSFEFKGGEFYLSIMFGEDVFEDKVTIGTLTFNPKKEGNLSIIFENKSKVSSTQGYKYDGLGNYPNTTFKGCDIVIKGVGTGNFTKNLKGELDVSGGTTKIINEINVITNQKAPKVIVEELNVSEIKPNVSVVLNVDYNDVDFKLFSLIFIVSLIGGVMFGFLGKY